MKRLCHDILRDYKSQEDDGVLSPPINVAAQRKWQHTENSSSNRSWGTQNAANKRKEFARNI